MRSGTTARLVDSSFSLAAVLWTVVGVGAIATRRGRARRSDLTLAYSGICSAAEPALLERGAVLARAEGIRFVYGLGVILGAAEPLFYERVLQGVGA